MTSIKTPARTFDLDWWPNRLHFELGGVARVGELAGGLGRKRALIVCGRSVAAGPLFGRVQAALGGAYAGAFTEVGSHSPLDVIERAAKTARDLDIDVLVSVGGGSAIDSAKGIVLVDVAGEGYRTYARNARPGQAAPPAVPVPRLAHIAIPTTSGSGSELVPTCGLRDAALGRKLIFRDAALIPAIGMLDPAMTLQTPPALAAASGMTAVARCIEALYSARRNPVYDALALQALRMLAAGLPRTIASPEDLEARADCQIACSMSAIAANFNVSVVHAIGHIVGGRYGLQHGVSHAMLLAPAMRIVLPGIGTLQRQVLDALGGSGNEPSPDAAGAEAADRMAALVARLPLPVRLREVGVAEDDLTDLVDHAVGDPAMSASAIPLGREDIMTLLREVW